MASEISKLANACRAIEGTLAHLQTQIVTNAGGIKKDLKNLPWDPKERKEALARIDQAIEDAFANLETSVKDFPKLLKACVALQNRVVMLKDQISNQNLGLKDLEKEATEAKSCSNRAWNYMTYKSYRLVANTVSGIWNMTKKGVNLVTSPVTSRLPNVSDYLPFTTKSKSRAINFGF